MGRLTKDPDIRYTQGEKGLCVARYTLAVDRKLKKQGEQSADFISCVAWGKAGEVAEKYYKKGTKIAITGRIQTGSYKNKDGVTVYTEDVIVEDQEFAESKNASSGNASAPSAPTSAPTPSIPGVDGFMNVSGGIDEELPFN